MTVRELRVRLRRLLHRREDEMSMDAEMRMHIELETRERVAAGMSLDEARRTTVRDFGGIDRHKEEARDQRGFRFAEEAARDARHALRVLRRNPTYAIAAAVTLALGVGSATAIYSLVHGVLLRPLPYADPDRLAVVWERDVARSLDQNVVSVPAFEAIRQTSRSFSDVAALVPQPITLGGTEPERIMGADVSPSYFRLLGVHPAIGRGFSESDEAAGTNVVVLSDGLWRRRFGADPSLVDRSISLDGRPFKVLGVMPARFDPPAFGWLPAQQLWMPWGPTAQNRTWGRFLLVLGRLRDGITQDGARRDLAVIADRRAHTDPQLAEWSMNVVALATQITGDVRGPLLMLFAAVAVLLLLAAANVGGLMLDFMRRRHAELLLRRAIGADAGRLFRELLAHGLVLGSIGCGLGLVLAVLGTRGLIALLPPELPRLSSVNLDPAVLAAGIGLALVATLGCVLVVAWRTATESSGASRSGGSRITATVGRGGLVVVEIALSVVLTAMAGLMIRSFANLRSVHLGFDSDGVVAGRISLPNARYGSPDRQRAFFDLLGARIRAEPGIVAAGFITSRPFACCAPATDAANPEDPSHDGGVVDIRYADSSYFAALRIPIHAGHWFASQERPDGTPRVIINDRLAHALYRDSPVGKSIRIGLGDPVTADTIVNGLVVGVVGDVHLADSRSPPRATAYLATTRFPSIVRDVVIRGDAGTAAMFGALRNAMRDVDPTLPLSMAATLKQDVNTSLARDRFVTLVLTAFGLLSPLLAAVGTYGVFATDVTARRKEIGVRLALGADGSRVIGLLMQRALLLSAIGAAVGAVVGLIGARFMAGIVFGVPTSDPWSFAAVALLLIAVAALATIIPSLRAARISPLEAIRAD
jgi:predicted permease